MATDGPNLSKLQAFEIALDELAEEAHYPKEKGIPFEQRLSRIKVGMPSGFPEEVHESDEWNSTSFLGKYFKQEANKEIEETIFYGTRKAGKPKEHAAPYTHQQYLAKNYHELYSDKYWTKQFISWYWHQTEWQCKHKTARHKIFDITQPFMCTNTGTVFNVRRRL